MPTTGSFPRPGKIFAEKYRIEKLLGKGGFARVYLAEQVDLGRKVAIKALKLDNPGQSPADNSQELDPKLESIALRFEREARIVSQLKSPHTITIYDYGRMENGILYMVMEYVDGVELDEVPGPIEPRRVIHILRQVLQSLREAHAHGLLHRDIKPANIMLYTHLGQKDQVKLLDFGIAKAIGDATNDAGADLTAANALIGTPRYMSPEQIRGMDLGPPSDIYSLGLVIFELLVGQKAITNTDSIEILSKHLAPEPFEIPSNLKLHPKLFQIVHKMLAKPLDQRYASTEEVLADLEALDRFEGDLRVGGPPPFDSEPIQQLDESLIEPLDISDLVEIEPLPDAPAKKRGPIAAILVALSLLLIGAALFLWTSDSENPETPLNAANSASHEEQGHLEEVEEPAEDLKEPEADDALASRDTPPQLPQITLIRTRPSGATVWLNDRLFGISPVQFDANDFDFPVTVRVTLDEHSAQKTLTVPGEEFWIDLPRPEPEVEPKKAATPRSTTTRTSASSRPATKTQSSPREAAPRAPEIKADPPPEEPTGRTNTRRYLPLD